jgi:hypothetical protein
MWAEVIFSRDDLKGLLEQAFPLTIHLDVERRHSLSLSDLGEVKLVEDLGLHVVCKARIHWPLLGIDVPVDVSSLALVLIPTIEPGPDGDLLAFRASIEHADFAALPALLDDRITAAINARLSSKGAELSWNFSKALTHLVHVPSRLDPLESLSIRPAWGKARITSDAIVCAVSFHSALVRRGEPPPADVLLSPAAKSVAPLAIRPQSVGSDLATRIAATGAFALGVGIGYLLLRRVFRS